MENKTEKKVAFFHTTMNTPVSMKKAFEQKYPNVPLITVMDDGIVPEVIENGNHYTPAIVRKLIRFAMEAKESGACVAVCMCTTIAGAVMEARGAVDIPFLTIDGPMLEQAVAMGKNAALLITARTTLLSSADSIRRAACAAGHEDVHADTILVEGAFEALNEEHDKEKHDSLIANAIKDAASSHDVVVLGQISMADAKSKAGDVGVPVLDSLDSGLEQIRKYL